MLADRNSDEAFFYFHHFRLKLLRIKSKQKNVLLHKKCRAVNELRGIRKKNERKKCVGKF
jgi:hypothetical protein